MSAGGRKLLTPSHDHNSVTHNVHSLLQDDQLNTFYFVLAFCTHFISDTLCYIFVLYIIFDLFEYILFVLSASACLIRRANVLTACWLFHSKFVLVSTNLWLLCLLTKHDIWLYVHQVL